MRELQRLIQERLDGLRGVDEDDWGGADCAPCDMPSETAEALDVAAPSVAELKQRLPELGFRVTDDAVELDVEVLNARRAHAR